MTHLCRDVLADLRAERLPSREAVAAVQNAVRVVEDTLHATSALPEPGVPVLVPTERTALAIVSALIAEGWSPPAP